MKVSELIKSLKDLQREHGDLNVYRYGYAGFTEITKFPEIAHTRLLSGRESKPDKWQEGLFSRSTKENKGLKVIEL